MMGAREAPAADPVAEPFVGKIRVIIVDDSLTVRTIFKRMVDGDPGMAVVATASSAERALAQLKSMPVDVVLLDLEMPGMGGLDALPALLETGGEAQVLVVSSLTQDGAEATVAALSMGAADTMLKPRPGGFNDEYRSALLAKVRALGKSDKAADPAADKSPPLSHPLGAQALGRKLPQVVAVGASTGGIHAINRLLRSLPADFALPILITQHLPQSFVPVFARQIESLGARPTLIAEDGTEIRRGTIVIAAGHGHMVVRRIADRLIARISAEPARSGCMPSVDPMLASLAQACDGHVLAIMLSGMGRDGLEGAQALVDAGGTVFAQDAETSAVWGMPGAVAKAGLTSVIAPPEQLSEAIAHFAAASVHC
jgi:two-component system chemotaxis response regulator CheB